jgi:hypothetical protein
MAEFYSNVENIKSLIRQIVVGDPNQDRLATLDTTTVERYQKEIDNRINSILDPIYEVPLVKVTLPDGTSGFSGSIAYIANRMVAAQIVLSEYSEVAPNESGNARRMYNEAENELYGLTKGMIGAARIDGQRQRARNPFVPPSVHPREVPEPPKELP